MRTPMPSATLPLGQLRRLPTAETSLRGSFIDFTRAPVSHLALDSTQHVTNDVEYARLTAPTLRNNRGLRRV